MCLSISWFYFKSNLGPWRYSSQCSSPVQLLDFTVKKFRISCLIILYMFFDVYDMYALYVIVDSESTQNQNTGTRTEGMASADHHNEENCICDVGDDNQTEFGYGNSGTHICIFTHTHAHTHARARMHPTTHPHTHTRTHARTHARTYTHTFDSSKYFLQK